MKVMDSADGSGFGVKCLIWQRTVDLVLGPNPFVPSPPRETTHTGAELVDFVNGARARALKYFAETRHAEWGVDDADTKDQFTNKLQKLTENWESSRDDLLTCPKFNVLGHTVWDSDSDSIKVKDLLRGELRDLANAAAAFHLVSDANAAAARDGLVNGLAALAACGIDASGFNPPFTDDQWDTTTSMGGDTDDGMSQGEWDNVFKDLAKSLGKDGAGTAPGMLNAVAPDITMPSPAPTLPAAAQKTQQQAAKATVQPTVVPAKAAVPMAPRTKAFKMTHTLGPDIAVAVDETVVGGRQGVSLKLTNIPAEMIAKADVQVSKDSLKVAFSPTASVTVTCKNIIEGDSIVAKTSKKKKTLNVSAFMLKI